MNQKDRAQFLEIAERRYAEIFVTNQAVPWRDMRRYLESRLKGKNASRPRTATIALTNNDQSIPPVPDCH